MLKAIQSLFFNDDVINQWCWISINICSECHHSLSESALVSNNGLCPHCGHISNFSVCDFKKIAVARKSAGKYLKDDFII